MYHIFKLQRYIYIVCTRRHHHCQLTNT